MSKLLTLRSPEVLHFNNGTELLYGPNQEWFGDVWQQRAGCGPTACSAALWYLGKTRPRCRGLFDDSWLERDGMIRLMEQIWTFVTPGPLGVNRASILENGAINYGVERGVSLYCDVMEVPLFGRRPGMAQVSDFMDKSIGNDLPVAFLNLSNGNQSRLESWHWVLLTQYNSADKKAVMYDQSNRVQIDLASWLRTTLLGGAFVSIHG